MLEFEPFPKIPRIAKNTVCITEKLDGTNAHVFIIDKDEVPYTRFGTEMRSQLYPDLQDNILFENTDWLILAGSRKRFINDLERCNDNYGFAAWVRENAVELLKLGHGRHYGEWYGRGINRGYEMEDRRFALFNTKRWGEHNHNTPACCEVVPVLYEGKSYAGVEQGRMVSLSHHGSYASLGYMNPEGIIAYYPATNSYLKQTFDSPEGKWKQE